MLTCDCGCGHRFTISTETLKGIGFAWALNNAVLAGVLWMLLR
jgi:hypothetical protein